VNLKGDLVVSVVLFWHNISELGWLECGEIRTPVMLATLLAYSVT
jgi:hypothetical protein